MTESDPALGVSRALEISHEQEQGDQAEQLERQQNADEQLAQVLGREAGDDR